MVLLNGEADISFESRGGLGDGRWGWGEKTLREELSTDRIAEVIKF